VLNRRDFILQSATAGGALVLGGARLASGDQDAGAAAKADASQPVITITADTPWIVSATEPEPVERALADIQRDWYKVFGHVPVVLSAAPASWEGPVICFGNQIMSVPTAGRESFALGIQSLAGSRLAFVATGADVRGSIYAAYAFSERILGVDPWWYWADKEPARRESIKVPTDFNEHFGSPTFRYRGWFMNDEDLLHGFSPDPMRENAYSLEILDRICETLLRLRGNMVVPATFPFPDERCQELPARRGLMLNMHHILVVGLNTFRWPADVPFSYAKHPDIMERYWQTCIDAFKGKEVVWTVGYRGKNDQPFWEDEPDITTPQARGEVITRAIAKQVDLIRSVQPDAPIIANMWDEGAALYHQGLIKIPPGVTLVWPDNGSGTIRDNGQVQPGQGIYYHTMVVTFGGNHFSEQVPPQRIYHEMGRFVRANATKFFLLNVSNIRPAPLSTECAMRMAWDATPYSEKSDRENQEDFLLDWNRRQFGVDAGAGVAGIWREYFEILSRLPDIDYGDGNGPLPEYGEFATYFRLRMLGDLALPLLRTGQPLTAEMVRNAGGQSVFALFDAAVIGKAESLSAVATAQFKFASTNAAYYAPLLAKAESLAAKIPADRRAFYNAYLLAELGFRMYSSEMLAAYAQSLLALGSGDRIGAIRWVKRSLAANDALVEAMHHAEDGKWAGWYFGNGFGMEESRDQIRLSLAALRGEQAPPTRSPRGYSDIEKYQERFRQNFPLLY
jgi:hypothetical protein